MNADFTPNVTKTGPIVACDNAIQHYDRALDEVEDRRQRAVRGLQSIHAEAALLKEMKLSWMAAKNVLVQAQAQEEPPLSQ